MTEVDEEIERAIEQVRAGLKVLMSDATDEQVQAAIARLLIYPRREATLPDFSAYQTPPSPPQEPGPPELSAFARRRAKELAEEQEADERRTGRRERDYKLTLFRSVLREANQRAEADLGRSAERDDAE